MQSLGISTSIVCTTYTICRRSGNVGLKLLIWQTKTFQSNGNPTKIISNQIWNFLCSSIFGIFLYTHSCCTRSDILFINSNDLDFCLCLSYEYLSKCFRNEILLINNHYMCIPIVLQNKDEYVVQQKKKLKWD